MAKKKWQCLTAKEKQIGITGLAVILVFAIAIVSSLSSSKNSDYGATSTQGSDSTQTDPTTTQDSAAQAASTSDTQATASPTLTQPAEPSVTVSQENALNKAKDYLSYSAFSHDGLVDQLEYEKFTPDQAAYGANAVGL